METRKMARITILISIVIFLLCLLASFANACKTSFKESKNSYLPYLQLEEVVEITHITKGCSYNYDEKKYEFHLRGSREITTVDINKKYRTYLVTQYNYHTYPPCFVNPFIGDCFVIGFYNEDFRSVLGKPEKLYPVGEGE